MKKMSIEYRPTTPHSFIAKIEKDGSISKTRMPNGLLSIIGICHASDDNGFASVNRETLNYLLGKEFMAVCDDLINAKN